MKEPEGNGPEIAPSMSVLDVVSRYRSTQTVFDRYNEKAGECICCASLFDSLHDVSAKYGLDLDALLHDLKSAACNDHPPNVPASDTPTT